MSYDGADRALRYRDECINDYHGSVRYSNITPSDDGYYRAGFACQRR